MTPFIIFLVIIAGLIFGALAAAGREKKSDASIHMKEHLTMESLIGSLKQTIDDSINADLGELGLSGAEREKRERQKSVLSQKTREAAWGDTGDGIYVRECIKELLEKKEGVTPETICRLIPFNEPEAMTAQELFYYMYICCRRENPFDVFKGVVKRFKWDEPKLDLQGNPVYIITEEDVRKAFDSFTIEGTYDDQLDTLTQRVYEKMYGNDVADLFINDESVDGIEAGTGGLTHNDYSYINELYGAGNAHEMQKAYNRLYVVLEGKFYRMAFLGFGSEKALQRVTKNIYRYDCRKILSKNTPVIQSHMKNGARVKVTRPPASPTYTSYVRKFTSSDAKNFENLITDTGSSLPIGLIKALVRAEFNIVFSGDPGSGKTTSMKAAIGEINPQYCIRTAEHTFELGAGDLYPNKNVQALQEAGDFTIYDAITATRGMDTDVIIVGECNEPRLVGVLIQIAQSGSKFFMTSLHHESTDKLIDYSVNALMCESGIADAGIVLKQVVESINFDIHMVRTVSGHFYIERITEIVPESRDKYPDEMNAATREFYSRVTDSKGYTTNNIISFDTEEQCYKVTGKLSENTLAKINRMLGDKAEELIGECCYEGTRL